MAQGLLAYDDPTTRSDCLLCGSRASVTTDHRLSGRRGDVRVCASCGWTSTVKTIPMGRLAEEAADGDLG